MLEYAQITLANISSRAQFIAMFFAFITVLVFFSTGRGKLSWDHTLQKSGRVNVILLLFNTAALILPVTAAAYAVYLLQSLPHLSPVVWDDAPWLVRALVALLIFDLANYAAHRWMHSNDWLWPLHAVHHSDTDLHFLSANRAHILEWVILFPIGTAAAFFCGLAITDVVFLGLAREAHQYYVHSRLDWSHGPFRY
ncbi:MAG: sterol desaturase family protein, partial [Pseudomonadota bacterium]